LSALSQRAGPKWPTRALAVGLGLLFLLGPSRLRAQEDRPRVDVPPKARMVNPVPAGLTSTKLDVHQFQVVERESGSFSYYKVVEDLVEPFLRAAYRPPLETVVIGYDVTDELRSSARKLRWKWRAMALPKDGDVCREGYGDSAAAVYVAWKRFLKIYSLKFVWSTVGTRGLTCDKNSNLFIAQQTEILESGGPIGVWVSEEIDLREEFRIHFANNDPEASVPEFLGIGVMSDGDQTFSVSEADYTSFVLLHEPKGKE